MNSEQILKAVRRWAIQLGPSEVIRRLVIEGVSVFVADRMAHGVYNSDLRLKTASKVLAALKNGGVDLEDAS